jgi:hypothetical protein
MAATNQESLSVTIKNFFASELLINDQAKLLETSSVSM